MISGNYIYVLGKKVLKGKFKKNKKNILIIGWGCLILNNKVIWLRFMYCW